MKSILFKILTVLVCLALLGAFVACDETGNPQGSETQQSTESGTQQSTESETQAPAQSETQAPTQSETQAPAQSETQAPTQSETQAPAQSETQEEAKDTGVSEDTWNSMISDDIFANYTVEMKGLMTAYFNGTSQGESDAHAIYHITNDAIEFVIMDQGEPVGSMVLEGNDAISQKYEFSIIFRSILNEYDKFVYDPETDEYLIDDATINVDAHVVTNGVLSEDTIPVVIEVKNGKASFSEDDKIAKLVCDYTQTMTQNGGTTKVTGVVSWTFSDFGTTVITNEGNGGNGGPSGGSNNVDSFQISWEAVKSCFSNYTANVHSKGQVYIDGNLRGDSETDGCVMITETAVSDNGEVYCDNEAILVAETYNSFFLALLDQNESFVYDAEKDQYNFTSLEFTVNVPLIVNGVFSDERIDCKYVISEGSLVVSKTCVVEKLDCTYVLTMDLNGSEMVNNTTRNWTFSNHGRTLVEVLNDIG